MLDAAMRYAEKERVPKEKKFQEGDGTKLQTKAEEVELSLKQQFEDSHQQNIASSETFEGDYMFNNLIINMCLDAYLRVLVYTLKRKPNSPKI